MNTEFISLYLLLGFALLANIPLGYLRHGVRKRSALWFLYIHLSIPFIIALRTYLGFSWHLIPITISCAAMGQLLGGHLCKRQQG